MAVSCVGKRWSLLFAGAAVSCLAAFAAPAQAAPPANDAFASAAVAGPGLPISISGTNVEATAQAGEPNHTTFGSGPHRSVWYRWTPSVSGTAVIETCTSDFDTTMGVYTGSSVSGLAEVAKSDDDCAAGQGSSVTVSAAAGTTYRIAVDGFDLTEDGAFTLAIRGLAPPPNDDFANRQTIGPGLPIDASGTTVDAGAELEEPDHLGFGQAANSVWFQWTPSAAAYVEVDTCGSQADVAPAVYTGASLEFLGIVAGDGGCRVTFSAAEGTSYKIALDSFVEGGAELRINVLSAPANDNFVNRQTLGPGLPATAPGTIEAATTEAGEPNHFGFSTGPRRSIWYQWTASAAGQVKVDTCGSESAVRPAVYTGSAVNSLTPVAQSGNQCSLILTASAGTNYKIVLDGFSPTGTELVVRTLGPPANDDFANRQTVGPALPVGATGTTVDATSEAGEPDHGTGGGALRSVWYAWTPGAAAQVKASVCQSNPDFDPPAVAVYTGSSLASLTPVGTSDGCAVTFSASPGVAYKIAIDAAEEGPALLDIHALSPPANDSFANRTTIGPELPITASGTTADATAEAGEPDHLGLGEGATRSVWYAWTPAAGGTVGIDACGSPDQVGVAVYTGGTVGSLTLVAGGDLSCAVSLSAVAGTDYRIALDGFTDSAVSLTLEASSPPPDPPDPPTLQGTNPVSGSNDNDPRVLGTAEAGATVRLYANTSCIGSPVAIGSAEALESPGLQVTVMDNTTTTFRATTENANGISSCSAGITYLETTPPPAPLGLTVTPASGSDDNNPTVGGSAAAGTTIELYAGTACTGSPVATGTAAGFGSVGFTVPVADNSTTTFRATASNANGTSACSDPVTYTEVTPPPPAPPAPTELSVTPASGSNDNSPMVSGTAEAGTTVRIYAGALCTGTPIASGTAAQFASPGLTVAVADNSTTTFHAAAQNANGTSPCSSGVTYAEVTPPPPGAPAAPTGLSTTPVTGENDNSPEVTGSAPADTTVKVYADEACTGQPVATGTAAEFASTGLTVTVADNSTTTFRATAANANGTSPCSTSYATFEEVTRTPGGTPTNPPTTTASVTPPAATPPAAKATGLRAAALRKCKKLKGRARATCLKKAKKLPI